MGVTRVNNLCQVLRVTMQVTALSLSFFSFFLFVFQAALTRSTSLHDYFHCHPYHPYAVVSTWHSLFTQVIPNSVLDLTLKIQKLLVLF